MLHYNVYRHVHVVVGYYKRPLYSCQSKLRLKSSCYKKLRYRENTARPSCLVGVLYDISRERFC